MKKTLLIATLFAAATCNAQVVLWDGEDETITSINEYGGWWDRGNPSVVDNPDKTGINTSNKCLKFTMTGNDFGQKHLACPFRDWMNADKGNQLNLNGNRRFSLMVKKAQNENLLVELSDPINDAIARVLRRMWRDGKLTINKINTMNILWLLILMPIGLLLNKWTRSGHK